jgi:hypothetical protein
VLIMKLRPVHAAIAGAALAAAVIASPAIGADPDPPEQGRSSGPGESWEPGAAQPTGVSKATGTTWRAGPAQPPAKNVDHHAAAKVDKSDKGVKNARATKDLGKKNAAPTRDRGAR